jgi:D-hydroxyproline dehydrogenase subunit alpha
MIKFDILIIGSGPAGLHAARVGAQAGKRVCIVDDNALPGGQIWRQGPHHAPRTMAIEAIARYSNVTRLHGTRVVQSLPDRQMLVEDASRGFRLSYDKLIVATGARERFVPYPGWTLPGVTGAGGLQALIKGGTPVRGERIVIAGTGPLLWAAAVTARGQGAKVVAIVEQTPADKVRRFAAGLWRTPSKLAQAMRMRFHLRATPYFCGAHVTQAHGESGVTHVRVRHGAEERHFDCDRLACAYGLVPNTQIGQALGCDVLDAALKVDEWQATSVSHVFAAGECTGVGGMELSAVEGCIAAHAALGQHDAARAFFAQRDRYRQFAQRMHDAFSLDTALRTLATPDTLICRCEDVRFGDAASHRTWREAKLHTRCGMGPCQGKICGDAAAFCFGWEASGQRPPFAPARIATLLEA